MARREATRDWEGDKRDAVADQRDAAADVRDAAAARRDAVADVREDQLRLWEQQLETRARHLGLVSGDPWSPVALSEAATARDAAANERATRAAEREEAAVAREASAARRTATRRDTLLAAAFAGIAEYLHESETPEQLLTRVSEVAVTMIAGSTRAPVTPDARDECAGVGPDPEPGSSNQSTWSMSFSLDAPTDAGAEPRALALNVFSDDPAAVDRAAEDLGVILAAHASLAARSLSERVRLERLEEALSSRDVIGRAKGILEERLKISSEEAFELLKRSSQLLNVKLREVAHTLAETGEIPASRPPKR